MKHNVMYRTLLMLTILLILPLYWIFVGSFLPEEVFAFHYSSTQRSPAWFAFPPTFKQYESLLYPENYVYHTFLQHFGVSILSASCITVLSLLIIPPLGFYLAKAKGRMTNLLFFFVVLTMLSPSQVTMTPTMILCKQIGIYNTWWAILLPSVVMPFGIFLMRQSIRALPVEVLEAVRLDTDSFFVVLWRIVVPVSIPAVLTLLMIGFGEFYSMIEQPLILLDPTYHIMPLSIAMNDISRITNTSIFAASVLFIFPCVVIYFLLRKPMIDMIENLQLL